MVKVEFGMVKDKFWLFYTEGEEQPAMVQVTAVRGKTVDLSNGESIPAERFYELCEPAMDEEPLVAEETQQNHNLMDELENLGIDTGGQGKASNQPGGSLVDEVMQGIQFDENGIPLPAKGGSQPQQRPIHQTQHRHQQPTQQHQVVESPLIALTEKGKTKITKLNFSIEFPTVDKVLFNALVDTYPEEEIELLLEHFINKVGIDNIKQIIKDRVLQHYKPTTKKDATS